MPPLDVKSLRDAIASGRTFDYVFFWGHTAQPDGALSPTCFSQWWPAPFEIEGETFSTAEHWMMASKARLFGDEETRAKILAAGTPELAKKLGRSVRGFDEARWDAERVDIVTRGSVAKFTSDPRLRAYLLRTREAILVEASPTDAIWGIGHAASDPVAADPMAWRGLNLLGFALVHARAILREEVETLDGI